jgi:hypothetical protein
LEERENECQIWITVDSERCNSLVVEFIPLTWEGELPGWRCRWLLPTTNDAWHLQTIIREVYLPITQQQPNVIANFKISPWNEFSMFLTERDCRELLKMLDEAIRVARPSTLWTPE